MTESPLRVLFVGPDRDSYVRLRRALGRLGDRSLRLDWIASLTAAVHVLEHLHPDVCVIDPALARESMLDDLHRLAEGAHGPPSRFLRPRTGSSQGGSVRTRRRAGVEI